VRARARVCVCVCEYVCLCKLAFVCCMCVLAMWGHSQVTIDRAVTIVSSLVDTLSRFSLSLS
jgi:hypothetical protein